MTASTFDPQWESVYSEGHQLNRYPWDTVVSFVFSNAPKNKPRSDIRILEIGCGAASNLWFAAREGFQVAGVDGSASVIEYARWRFAEEGLSADLRVADFTRLPFADGSFDLAIDRGSLVCCGRSAAHQAVREIRRVLLPGGRFFCNPYSATHTSHSASRPGEDGLRHDITGGSLAGIGQLCFYDRNDVDGLFSGWIVREIRHMEIHEEFPEAGQIHSEWRIVAEKPA